MSHGSSIKSWILFVSASVGICQSSWALAQITNPRYIEMQKAERRFHNPSLHSLGKSAVLSKKFTNATIFYLSFHLQAAKFHFIDKQNGSKLECDHIQQGSQQTRATQHCWRDLGKNVPLRSPPNINEVTRTLANSITTHPSTDISHSEHPILLFWTLMWLQHTTSPSQNWNSISRLSKNWSLTSN